MGVIMLVAIAATTVGFLAWDFKRTADRAGASWTDFYTHDRMEAHAYRLNPTWLAELRARRQGDAEQALEEPVKAAA